MLRCRYYYSAINFENGAAMKFRFLTSTAIILITVLMIAACSSDNRPIQFGIDYNKITAPELKGYDLVVLEQDRYTEHELHELTQSDTRILGYFSMSEVHLSRAYFQELKKIGFLGKNENWNSYYLNLEDSTVRSIMLDGVLPNVMKNGLDGLLLDTIDGVAPYTERNQLAG